MRKKQTSFYLILFLVFGSLLGFSLAGCEMPFTSQPEPTLLPRALTATWQANPYKQFSTEGKVVPLDYANLNFVNPGLIEEIYVQEGDYVTTGQVLARQKGQAQLEAAIAAAELGLLQAQQALDTLYDNADLVSANAKLTLALAEKAYEDAKRKREDQNHMVGSQYMIEMAYATYLTSQHEVDKLEESYKRVESLPADNKDRAKVVADLTKAREKRDRDRTTWNYWKSLPDDTMISKVEGELEVARAQYDKAKIDAIRLKDGIDPDDLELAQSRIRDAQVRVESIKSNLRDIELRAPIDGTITTSNIEVGQLFIPSVSTAITIANTSAWRVETTDLTELNIVGVMEGTPAQVTFDALPGQEFNGHVERIKKIGVNKQGDITYTTVIVLDQWDERLLWNMSAKVKLDTTKGD